MSYEPETPFENIESAQEFISLLIESIEEAKKDVEEDIARPQPDRRIEALQLVAYNLEKLLTHMTTSQRILNDLRTLRRLMYQERELDQRIADR